MIQELYARIWNIGRLMRLTKSGSIFPSKKNQSICCTSNKVTRFYRTWNITFECMGLFKTLVNVASFLMCVWSFCDSRYYRVKSSEAVAKRCSVRKVFIKILQNSQKNTCARAFFLIKLQAEFVYRTPPVVLKVGLWSFKKICLFS